MFFASFHPFQKCQHFNSAIEFTSQVQLEKHGADNSQGREHSSERLKFIELHKVSTEVICHHDLYEED